MNRETACPRIASSAIAWAAAALMLVSAGARAQRADSATTRVLFVNDEFERYARVLQLTGDVPLYPWSVRSFGLREAERLVPLSGQHPWASAPQQRWRRERWYAFGVLQTNAQTIWNSAFPYGYNDGPVWAGRGLTMVVNGGVAAKAGPVSAIIAPLLFRAANTAFPFVPSGVPGIQQYGDYIHDGGIDQPQRFGDRAYQRLDPGNSSIRIDAGPATAGFSTGNEHWGPARDHPLILGNNAPGFPHVFLGTTRPLDLWIVKVHTRAFWARVQPSPLFPRDQFQPDRMMASAAAAFIPRGVPGLEIGGARVFHVLWSDSVLSVSNLTRIFTPPWRDPQYQSDPGNQIASAFFRWAFPGAGVEVYGEYAGEDYALSLRHLLGEPEMDAGYLVGFQRASGKGSRRSVVRGEVLNTRINNLQLSRDQTRFYVHGPVPQGHTSIGQVLGSVGAFGGGAAELAYDRYSPGGRWSIGWSRIMRAEERLASANYIPDPMHADVMHALTFDGLRFRGRLAITYELTGVYDLNRNFSRDVFNLRGASGIQYVW